MTYSNDMHRGRRVLACVFLCTELLVASVRRVQADGDRWINIGPAPILGAQAWSGRVRSIAVDPDDNTHWLIGAAQGGVWETRDSGATWIPKTDDQASLAIGAIAFSPGDARIIYVGTGEPGWFNLAYAGQGVLKSTDGGTTWALLGTTSFAHTSVSDIAVDPTNPAIVVASTTVGAAGRYATVFPHGVLAAPPRGVFKSVDGGVTWSQRLNGDATSVEVDRTNFARQYAGIGQTVGGPLNGVYRSIDAGDTWQLVDGPWSTTPSRVGRIELALAPAQPNVLYVSIQDTLDGVGNLLGLYRTDNAWAATPGWVQIPTGATDDGSGRYGYCGWSGGQPKPQCFFDHTILVDKANPDVLYAGGVPLWRFDGTTWTEISRLSTRRSIHYDQHALAWAGNRLIVGNDGGVWSSTDEGATWSNHNTNLAITQFYKGALHPTNPNFALGGSQDNGYETWNGSDAWALVGIGGDGMDMVISSSQPATRWGIVDYSLAVSQAVVGTGGRAALFPAGTGLDRTNAPFVSRLEKCPANENVFIAGTNTLWKSTDFFSAPILPGPHWSANGPQMGECVSAAAEFAGHFGTEAGCITALGFAAADASCGTYAVATADGRLRRTTDGGSTWVDLDASNAVPNRFVTDLAFAPIDANTLYVTLSGFDEGTPDQPGHIFKTTNALAAVPAWVNVSPPVDQPQNAIAVDPADAQLVYAGADTGVWKSRDGAGTWTHMGPESGMPNVAVFDLQIHPTVRRAFAFTHGRGAFVIACRNNAECDDQDASNGTETCDVASGRCQAGVVCTGDCDGTGTVTIDEIIKMVNIALGTAQPLPCPNGIPNGAAVNVTLVIQAVTNALDDCSAVPTSTPTPTPAPPVQTPTVTPSCAVTVSGQVYDATAGPDRGIAGAQVVIHLDVPRIFSATTDPDGRYSLLVPEPYGCRVVSLEATANGYAATLVPITPAALLAQPTRNFALTRP